MHLGLIGYGTIARSLIGMLDVSKVPGVTVLVRASSFENVRKETPPTTTGPAVTFVTSLDALLETCPAIIVECAGHSAVQTFAAPILRHGTDLILASVGSLANEELYGRMTWASREGGAHLTIPAGAIGGLDLLRALATSDTPDVTYRGTKPPGAWKGSPAENAIDLEAIADRTVFFSGTGREAAMAYPKNANVVAAIALAGAGFDRMKVELVADPDATANTHAYEVSSPMCSYSIQIENAPLPGNARTSMTTVASLLVEVLQKCSDTERHS